MSANGENQKNERADTGSKWVWWSTEESFERGTISVLACAEVAAGIGLYWWLIPWWFETNLHLLISVFIAPLLLLRSPESVDEALAAFERYHIFHEDEGFSFRSKQGAVAMLLAAGLSALVSWGLAETWLSGHDGWSLFWRAGIIGWISIQIGIAGALAGVGVLTVALAGAGAGAVAGALAGALAGAGPEALAGVGAGAGAVAGVIAGIVAGASAGALAGAYAGAGALLGPGILLGMWLRSVIIRIDSTLRHGKEGWKQLSENWRILVWAHDLRRPPELLPGIDRHPVLHYLGFGSLLNRYKPKSGGDRVFDIVVAALSLPIFYLPALLYRLSLKSTCWFWWPLVFSQTSGRAAVEEVAEDGIQGAVVVFTEQSENWLARFVGVLSLALLLSAIGAPESLLALLPVSRGGIDLIGSLGDMIYLMLPCAGVQLALFLLCNRFLARAKAGKLGSRHRTAFVWLINLRQLLLRSALVTAFMLFLVNWVPGFSPFAGFIETHYFSLFPLLTWT